MPAWCGPMMRTAVFRKAPEGNGGFVEDLAVANVRGATREQARSNVHEAAWPPDVQYLRIPAHLDE